jgi:hypothetical protein
MVLYAGYSLTLVASSNQTGQSNYPYIGEWHSKTITPTASIFCLELDISASSGLQMHIDLVTSDINDQQHVRKETVFEASSFGDVQLKLLAELPLSFQAKVTTLAKLIVYVSANMTINDVNFQPSRCLIQSKCASFLFVIEHGFILLLRIVVFKSV